MGYHKRDIRFSGKFGTLEKVLEEVDEAIEALEQKNPILLYVELSDIYLALKGVADKQGISMEAIVAMAEATERAFASGKRQPKPDPNVGKSYRNPSTPENMDAKLMDKPNMYPQDVKPLHYCTSLRKIDDEVYECRECGKSHYGK